MSLNRTEQRIYDYLRGQAEERQYWVGKVQSISQGDPDASAARLAGELWRYYVERASIVPSLKEAAAREGLARTSMRNLAELLLRQWGRLPARPARSPEQYYFPSD